MKEGLAQAEGELIAIFDADFVPEPDFLRRMVPHFQDPEVGLVQSRWTHLNEHYSLFTRLQALALDTHFMVEQMGRNQAGAFINFNGTGGIWRKACILDAGNWEADTLTEDLDLSYRAQQKGWRFVYRPDVPSPAELPPVMAAIKSQQFRWTKGGAECARKHLRNVWRSPAALLTKVHATAHLLNATIFIAVLLTALSSIPLWWGFYAGHIPFDLYAAALFFLLGFVLIAAVYAVANFTLSPKTPGSLLRFLYELPLFLSVSMGLSLHNAGAVWEGLSGKKSAFIRTPKYNLAEGQRGAWAQNVYHRFRIPLSTYVEFGLFLVFGGMVLLGWWTGTRELLLFHGMLCLGFGLVSIASFRSS
ncbi:glycosyltransferase family 2 protein [Nitritalea halalkaliphila]|uniref:glycosyltransferase family 2 protein n=1 Tax=Nitritalea halalkaliphila TaxID=590849 RepID=UPI002934BE23|nr:glycosyltransferase family 2 protein [Nitritalea halalkaliphila]